jgi:hypothetical protein
MVLCVRGARGGFIEPLLEASLVAAVVGTTRVGSGAQ